jgi:hypothetical protein
MTMRETLTAAIVAEAIKELRLVFPGRKQDEQVAAVAEVYLKGLAGIDAEAFRAAVKFCIANDSYFPKIARLREVAGEWVRRNRATIEPSFTRHPLACPICGAEPTAAHSLSGNRTSIMHDRALHKVSTFHGDN